MNDVRYPKNTVARLVACKFVGFAIVFAWILFSLSLLYFVFCILANAPGPPHDKHYWTTDEMWKPTVASGGLVTTATFLLIVGLRTLFFWLSPQCPKCKCLLAVKPDSYHSDDFVGWVIQNGRCGNCQYDVFDTPYRIEMRLEQAKYDEKKDEERRCSAVRAAEAEIAKKIAKKTAAEKADQALRAIDRLK